MIMITGQKGILRIAAGAVPDRRHRRGDEAADQAGAPDRLAGDDSDARARAFRVAQEERPGPVHLELPEDIAAEEARRRRSIPPHPVELPVASAAALDRAAALILRGQASAGHARRREPPGRGRAPISPSSSLRTRIPYLHDADGQGRCSRRHRSLHGHRRALRARLCSRGDRARRPHHHHRPRHGREAAFHHGAERAHRSSMSATSRPLSSRSISRRPRSSATSGPSLRLLADRVEGKHPERAGAAAAARGHPRADRDRARPRTASLTPQRARA